MTDIASGTREVCALLADGSTVRLRPACPEDRGQVLRLYDEMSADNLRSRFFAVSRRSGEQAADRLCAQPGPGHRILVALRGDRLVGVAEYETVDDPSSAEIALAVADDFHHRGVGTLLLEHLVHIARENGITAFTADVLADNHVIHKVFADLGLRFTRQYDGTTVRGVIRLAPDERYLSAVDIRGRTNTEEPVRMDATFAVTKPLPGTAGVAVQSGGVGIALLDGLSRLGIGVSSFVSLGDKRDVSSNDLLQWWECDGRTDVVLLHLESFGNPRAFLAIGADLVTALTAPVPKDRACLPVAVVLLDQVERVRLLGTDDGRMVPSYGEPQSAARALCHAAERAHWLSRPQGRVVEPTGVDASGARALAEEFLARVPAGGWLGARDTDQLFARYDIPRLRQACAATEQEAVDAAARLAGPDGGVVLKAQGPELVHKSDRGAVLLDLHGEQQVRAAYRDLTARLGAAMAEVLVQPMAARGTELLAGVVQDDVFGALVLFGLGGTTSELLADHAAPRPAHGHRYLRTAHRTALCAVAVRLPGQPPGRRRWPGGSAGASFPDGRRPSRARRGRVQSGYRQTGRNHRRRRPGPPAAAVWARPLPAPASMRQDTS